jgi:adenosylmethionine-8-amino-7-oxononanoate aminotransferase
MLEVSAFFSDSFFVQMTASPNYNSYREIDFQHLWHPFTQQKVWFEENQPLIVERAEGVELIDVDGNRYLDGVSSLWCNVHGHAVPELLSAIQNQANKVCHSTLLGLSHTAVLDLTSELFKILPKHFSKVFYSDSGSAAVEAALRMALEWWQKNDSHAAKKKTKLVSLAEAYHGDTLGSVGIGYSEPFHRALKSHLSESYKICPPHYLRMYQGQSAESAVTKSLAEVEQLFKSKADEIAAFFIEPIVQGAAGIWIQPAEYLGKIAELCKSYNVLLVADEVATGFGKTGRMFAVEHAAIEPDIMVLGKSLTAGYLPLSCVVTTEKIFNGFLGEPEELKTFFFGQTFSGNPLAAAVACENLKLLQSNHVLANLSERIPYFNQLLDSTINPLVNVFEVRSQGVMVGIELTRTQGKFDPFSANELAGLKVVREARARGVVIRSIGNVMILMPALVMENEDLKKLVEVTAESIDAALAK